MRQKRLWVKIDISDGKKRCPKCGKRKPLTAFSKTKSHWTGRASHCRPCRKIYTKSHRQQMAGMHDPTIEKRFWKYVKKLRADFGCWAWRGSIDPAGYGRIMYQGWPGYAHLIACEVFQGRIKEPGQCASWTCRTGIMCVNPDHVVFVPRVERMKRCVRPNVSGRNAAKTACEPHGHPFDETNTYWIKTAKGLGRICIACHRLRCPGTAIVPNAPADAERKNHDRLLQLIDEGIRARRLPEVIREDVRNEVYVTMAGRKAGTKEVAEAFRAATRIAYQMLPNPFGRSLNAPLGDDGATGLDLLEDESPLSDPDLMYQLSQLTADDPGWQDGAEGD